MTTTTTTKLTPLGNVTVHAHERSFDRFFFAFDQILYKLSKCRGWIITWNVANTTWLWFDCRIFRNQRLLMCVVAGGRRGSGSEGRDVNDTLTFMSSIALSSNARRSRSLFAFRFFCLLLFLPGEREAGVGLDVCCRCNLHFCLNSNRQVFLSN